MLNITEKDWDWIPEIIGRLIGIAIITLLLGFVIEYTWNEVMPFAFDVPSITYWQAVMLKVLTQLFKPFKDE